MGEISATIKYVRTSPKKLREAVLLTKGLRPDKALEKLKFAPLRAARPLSAAIESAIANAKNNLNIPVEDLKIKLVEINSGPKFKRFRAVSRGMAHKYAKKTSHIKIVLEGSYGTKN